MLIYPRLLSLVPQAALIHYGCKVSQARFRAFSTARGQTVVYGPPGTGKTYWARKTVLELAALRAFGRHFAELSVEEQAEVEGSEVRPGLVRTCTFHPGYGYEDFLEGFRP